MHASLSILLSLLLPYCTTFSAAASVDCFHQIGDSYTTPSNTTSQISAMVECSRSENRTCQLPSGGFLNVPSTLTINSTPTAEIFETIGKAVKTEFKKSLYGAVPNSTFPIQPGQTGYIAFTSILRCYDGVIVGSECFDDVPAGESVTACQPSILSGHTSQGVPNLNGVAAFVTTTGERTASNRADNPAASLTDSPAAISTDNPAATTEPDADSGAVKLLSQGGWWPTMMMLTVVMAAMGIGSCSVVF